MYTDQSTASRSNQGERPDVEAVANRAAFTRVEIHLNETDAVQS